MKHIYEQGYQAQLDKLGFSMQALKAPLTRISGMFKSLASPTVTNPATNAIAMKQPLTQKVRNAFTPQPKNPIFFEDESPNAPAFKAMLQRRGNPSEGRVSGQEMHNKIQAYLSRMPQTTSPQQSHGWLNKPTTTTPSMMFGATRPSIPQPTMATKIGAHMTSKEIAAHVLEKVAVSRWREAIYSGELPTQEAERLKQYMGANPNRYADSLVAGVKNRLAERHNSYEESPKYNMKNIRGDLANNVSNTQFSGDVHVSQPQTRTLGASYGMKNTPENQKQLLGLIMSHEGMESDFGDKNKQRKMEKAWNRSQLNKPVFNDIEAQSRMSPRDFALMHRQKEQAYQKATAAIAKRVPTMSVSNMFHPVPTKINNNIKNILEFERARVGTLGVLNPSLSQFSPNELTDLMAGQGKIMLQTGHHAHPSVLINEARQARMMSPEVRKVMEKLRTSQTGEAQLMREASDTPITSKNTLLPKKDIPQISKRMQGLSDINTQNHLLRFQEDTRGAYNKYLPPARNAVNKMTGLLMKAKGLLRR